MNINPVQPNSIQNLTGLQPDAKAGSAARQIGSSFENALQSLSQTQAESDGLIEKLAAGENVDLHQVMLASEQTDINFRVAMAIRDRLVDAYREVMRMTV
jgi:flagellar hook-basal body complex protein FliE